MYIYKPRNTAGTLFHAAQVLAKECDYLMLCDPDMIFRRRPLLKNVLSGSFYSYMDYGNELVKTAARRCNVAQSDLINRDGLRCGVPYTIPINKAKQVARTWLYAMDQFDQGMWESIMYAFGIAVAKLGMEIRLNGFVGREYRMKAVADGPMIHYCYSYDAWDKRDYMTERSAKHVWDSSGSSIKGTIMDEISQQLCEAKNFYSPLFV